MHYRFRDLVFAAVSATFLLLVPSDARAKPPVLDGPVFGAESFVLDNGLTVLAIPNHRAPIVTHMIWYRAGSVDEEPGKSGVAHFLEHLMFKGTPSHPAGELTDFVARNGGDQNAFTSYDYTAYFQNITVDRLPLMMEMEADRMRNLQLDDEAVRTELQVVIEERRMRVDNVPSSILGERLDTALWLTNGYGVPVIGWPEELRALDHDDALAFYRKYYVPENAIVVVAGDITAKELKPLAEKYYGVIPRMGEPASRQRSTNMPRRADVRVSLAHEQVRQPEWWRTYIAPSFNVGERIDVPALAVLAEILGGGSTSKLYQEMVVDRKFAASASAAYNPRAVSYGTFSVSLTPSPGVPVERLEAAYDSFLADFLRDGITDVDVVRAKNRQIARLAYAKDSPIGAAFRVGNAMAIGLTLNEIESWPAMLDAVTAGQVRTAARHLVMHASSGTGVLLPETKAEMPGAGEAP